MNLIIIQISTSSRVLSITKLQVKFRYFFFQLHVNIVTSPKMRNYNSIRHVVSSPCLAILSLHCLTTNVSNDESNLNIKVIHVSFEKNIVNTHPLVKNKTYRYLILLNDGIVAIKPNKFNTYNYSIHREMRHNS